MSDFYNFCREVCVVILKDHSEPNGGPGRIVEIEESKYGKHQFNRGKKVDGVWVLGGIERDSDPLRCFFETVTDRSAKTLIPIIKRWILPSTTIYSDCWRSYLPLPPYIHSTVNHSVEFKSETGTHTNNIESRWHAVKKSLPRFGTRKDLYNSYFAEYYIRRKFVNGASDKFLQVLELIGRVYKPPEPEPSSVNLRSLQRSSPKNYLWRLQLHPLHAPLFTSRTLIGISKFQKSILTRMIWTPVGTCSC